MNVTFPFPAWSTPTIEREAAQTAAIWVATGEQSQCIGLDQPHGLAAGMMPVGGGAIHLLSGSDWPVRGREDRPWERHVSESALG